MNRYAHYLVISIAAILAYLPVSTMLFSLRNDVVAIEYPIQHFMSESIRNAQFPIWFNFWSMGFPLHSVLSWGIFSTPRMLLGTLGSNMFMLHAEFIFYVMSAGWIMYKLLKSHFHVDKTLALLLACCYMLSGFTVGSSQWLLYITGMTFIPLFFYCFIKLVRVPSNRHALFFAVSSFLLLTNVHIYLTLVTGYLFFFTITIYCIQKLLTKGRGTDHSLIFKKLGLGILLSIALCIAPLYYTYELVGFLERSAPLSDDPYFFQSNYFHPAGFKSLVIPLSIVKSTFENTEGSVLNIYMGLLPLLLFPASLVANFSRRINNGWILPGISLLFILISFGHLTPVRGWMNVLPGLGHFRHPAVLRIFFIMSFIIYLGKTFSNISLAELMILYKKSIRVTVLLLAILILGIVAFHLPGIFTLVSTFSRESLQGISGFQLTAISSIVQLGLIVVLVICYKLKKSMISYLLVAELVLNTLLCTPFFSISSYSPRQVDAILSPVSGFPIQQISPSAVQSSITDEKGNSWFNTNTFRKEITTNTSLAGPLILEKAELFLMSENGKEFLNNKPVVFPDSATGSSSEVRIISMFPSKIHAELFLEKQGKVVCQQVYYPGWEAKYNGKELKINNTSSPFIEVEVPQGKGLISFEFKRTFVMIIALILHGLVLIIVGFAVYQKLRIRSISPSLLSR